MARQFDLEATVGFGAETVITLIDPTTGDPAEFVAADVPSAVIWPGDDRVAAFNPTVAWDDASLGQLKVTIDGTDTTGLVPGDYRLLITIALDSGGSRAHRHRVRFLPAPGSATAGRTYVSADDVHRYAPAWFADLQTRTDQSGFAEQRHEASLWLDERIIDRFSSTWRKFGEVTYRIKRKTIRDWLDANALIVTQPVREIVARYTVAIVCEGQVGSETDHPYWEIARFNRELAETKLRQLTVELDTSGDGKADRLVSMGLHVRIER